MCTLQSKGPNGEDTFPLRYYVCDDKFTQPTKNQPGGPIFFYLGNESNVRTRPCLCCSLIGCGTGTRALHAELSVQHSHSVLRRRTSASVQKHVSVQVQLYLNATGLMWENAEQFGAMLVFAEHRYYGESSPFGKQSTFPMDWLSAEQALADYADLIHTLKADRGLEDSPVIGFGGSYGGMLATWARYKYPHIFQGAIAGSAPIWTFYDETPDMVRKLQSSLCAPALLALLCSHAAGGLRCCLCTHNACVMAWRGAIV
jgi:Serine carboxypeptidase S28